FWKYRRLDPAAIPQARMVAKFDNGDPAVLDVPVGKGRVILFTSGWQPDDSQLALSTKFVPLLYALLDYSGAASPAPVQYLVGGAPGRDVARGADGAAVAGDSVTSEGRNPKSEIRSPKSEKLSKRERSFSAFGLPASRNGIDKLAEILQPFAHTQSNVLAAGR